MVHLDDIRAARERIRPHVHHTPLFQSSYLDRRLGVTIAIKAESLQKTGSYKPRGVVNRLTELTTEERERGVVTVSAGNHAQAAAYACARESIPCAVVMPSHAPEVKIEATRGYGADVVLHDDMRSLFQRCEELRAERQATFVHPFDHPATIAGAGTTGLEILEDFADVDTILCGIGGGGLIAGVARAARSLAPAARVIGVEPEGAPTMSRALEAGEPVRLTEIDSIADGLCAPFAGDLNLEIVQQDVDSIVLVDDHDILAAMDVYFERLKLVVEPAGAAALAALLANKVPSLGSRVCVIASGGNLDVMRYASWRESAPRT